MASKTQGSASRTMRRGVRPMRPEQEVGPLVEALVEPDGDPRTHYGLVIAAMAERLNCWQLANSEVDEARDELFTALRQIQDLADRLDQLVEDSNVD